jgi:hypothetical protein
MNDVLYLGRFPAAGTKSTNKKDPLQVLRLRTALPAEPTSFSSLTPVLRLGLACTFVCFLISSMMTFPPSVYSVIKTFLI